MTHLHHDVPEDVMMIPAELAANRLSSAATLLRGCLRTVRTADPDDVGIVDAEQSLILAHDLLQSIIASLKGGGCRLGRCSDSDRLDLWVWTETPTPNRQARRALERRRQR